MYLIIAMIYICLALKNINYFLDINSPRYYMEPMTIPMWSIEIVTNKTVQMVSRSSVVEQYFAQLQQDFTSVQNYYQVQAVLQKYATIYIPDTTTSNNTYVRIDAPFQVAIASSNLTSVPFSNPQHIIYDVTSASTCKSLYHK